MGELERTTTFKEKVRKQPENANRWWKLGLACFREKRFRSAARAWLQTARRRPKVARVRYALGLALYKSEWQIARSDNFEDEDDPGAINDGVPHSTGFQSDDELVTAIQELAESIAA